jgi:hypothetical protein
VNSILLPKQSATWVDVLLVCLFVADIGEAAVQRSVIAGVLPKQSAT